MKTIAPADMKRLETEYMRCTGVSSLALMEKAAEALAEAAEAFLPEKGGRVLCFCGSGNNGGDGYAALRILAERRPELTGVCVMLKGPATPEAVFQKESLEPYAERIRCAFDADTERPDCVLDAVFGTGLCRAPEGHAAELIAEMNRWAAEGVPVLAADIPSGLDGESGRKPGIAVQADVTVTFHRPKPGLYLNEGPDCAGHVITADIGIPETEGADLPGFEVMTRKELACLLPKRRRCTHKGSYGRVLVWAGSPGMAGAAAFCAEAALRTGAGLVRIACPEKILHTVQVLCPAATALPLTEGETDALIRAVSEADAAAIGCGLGRASETARMLRAVLENCRETPIVLDADALNLLSERDLLPVLGANVMMTPHPAEAARLLHCGIGQVLSDPAVAMERIHALTGAGVMLKGACSLMTDGKETAVNPYGTAAMAKGGSGDVLCGILAALLAGRRAGAYAFSDLQAMQTACALHGLAGEEAERQLGERAVLPGDLCRFIGKGAAAL